MDTLPKMSKDSIAHILDGNAALKIFTDYVNFQKECVNILTVIDIYQNIEYHTYENHSSGFFPFKCIINKSSIQFGEKLWDGVELYVIPIKEYCTQGTLDQVMSNSTIDKKAELNLVSKHIGESLDILHNAGWIHCDIKSNNIVKCGDRYKLIDYGLMREIPKSRDIPASGLGNYVHPVFGNYTEDYFKKHKRFNKFYMEHSSKLQTLIENIDEICDAELVILWKYVDKFALGYTLACMCNDQCDMSLIVNFSYPDEVIGVIDRIKKVVSTSRSSSSRNTGTHVTPTIAQRCAQEIIRNQSGHGKSAKKIHRLQKMTVMQLRQLASRKNIRNRSKMNKSDLITSLAF